MAYKNPDDSKRYQKSWRVQNKERVRAYCRKWRIKNIERERKRTKEWMAAHPEYRKDYRSKNTEKVNALVRKNAHIPANKQKREEKRLMDIYRITLEEQNKIKSFQLSHPEYKMVLGKNDGTDHCHKTGLIRGIMDWRINMAYGLLEAAASSNERSLLDVIKALELYTAKNPAELALGEKRYGLIGLAKYKNKMIYGPPKEEQE